MMRKKLAKVKKLYISKINFRYIRWIKYKIMRRQYLKKNLEKFKNLVDNNINFSFIKVGDGEVLCMQNIVGQNCDGHPYSLELGEKLKESYIELCRRDNIFIGDWFYSNPDEECNEYYSKFISENNLMPSFCRPFEVMMLGWGNIQYDYLLNFYRSVKESNRNKIYVGPSRMNQIKDILNINHCVEVPLINAYSSYDDVFKKIKDVIADDSIIILCVGLQSPVLSNDILNYNKCTTILDIGSGFDPLFVGQTRGWEHSTMNESKNYMSRL